MDLEVSLKKFTEKIVPYLNSVAINKIIDEKYNLMAEIINGGIVDCYKVIYNHKSPYILITSIECSKEVESKLKKLTEN